MTSVEENFNQWRTSSPGENTCAPCILLVKFSKGRQDVECTLRLGTYVELVDREVVFKLQEALGKHSDWCPQRTKAVPQADISLPLCYNAQLCAVQQFNL